MAKLRITPNGTVLENEIILTNEALMRLTNPENAKRIKAALSDFGGASHRIEESDKNISVMSCPIKDGENIELVLEKLFKAHTGFIAWAQSLPTPTPTIDFKDPDEEDEDKINGDREVIKSMVKDFKEILNDDPLGCRTTLFFKGSIGRLMLSRDAIKILLNTFIEKYDKEKESL